MLMRPTADVVSWSVHSICDEYCHIVLTVMSGCCLVVAHHNTQKCFFDNKSQLTVFVTLKRYLMEPGPKHPSSTAAGSLVQRFVSRGCVRCRLIQQKWTKTRSQRSNHNMDSQSHPSVPRAALTFDALFDAIDSWDFPRGECAWLPATPWEEQGRPLWKVSGSKLRLANGHHLHESSSHPWSLSDWLNYPLTAEPMEHLTLTGDRKSFAALI